MRPPWTATLRGLRIGVPTNVFLDGVDDPVMAAMEAALLVLQERGATVTRLRLPVMDARRHLRQASSPAPKRRRSMPSGCATTRRRTVRISAAACTPATPFRPPTTSSRSAAVARCCAPSPATSSPVLTCWSRRPSRPCLPTLAETDIDHGPPGTEHKFMALSANTRPLQLPRSAGDQPALRLRPERLPDRPADRRSAVR